MATSAPSRAKAMAAARPIPESPPVISAFDPPAGRSRDSSLTMIGAWVHFAGKARPGLRLPLVGRLGIFASGVPEFRSGHALVPFAISGIETRCWCRGRRSLQGAFARVARHQHPNKPIVAASWNICRRRA